MQVTKPHSWHPVWLGGEAPPCAPDAPDAVVVVHLKVLWGQGQGGQWCSGEVRVRAERVVVDSCAAE
jgi:hypothetical protein